MASGKVRKIRFYLLDWLASMTCSKRQEIVSGPTPPISGVMAVRSLRFLISGSRSPFMMPFSLAVPASTRVAPGFIRLFLIKPGTPVADIIIS